MLRLALILMFGVTSLSAQAPNTNSAKTTGPCSPAIGGNNNTVHIVCNGLTKEQADKYLEVLNAMAKNQLPAEKVMGKLDDIKNGVDNCTQTARGWRLTDAQKAAMIAALSKYKPYAQLRLFVTNDSEAIQFAKDITETLNQAGWLASYHLASMLPGGGSPDTGLQVFMNREDYEAARINPAYKALVDVLEDQKVAINLNLVEGHPPPDKQFLVLMRPST